MAMTFAWIQQGQLILMDLMLMKSCMYHSSDPMGLRQNQRPRTNQPPRPQVHNFPRSIGANVSNEIDTQFDDGSGVSEQNSNEVSSPNKKETERFASQFTQEFAKILLSNGIVASGGKHSTSKNNASLGVTGVALKSGLKIRSDLQQQQAGILSPFKAYVIGHRV